MEAIHCMFSSAVTVQLGYLLPFSKIFPIMLVLCLILSVTYYIQNYAGIIGWFLLRRVRTCSFATTDGPLCLHRWSTLPHDQLQVLLKLRDPPLNLYFILKTNLSENPRYIATVICVACP